MKIDIFSHILPKEYKDSLIILRCSIMIQQFMEMPLP